MLYRQITCQEQSGHVAWYVWTNVTCKTGTVVRVMYSEGQLNVACTIKYIEHYLERMRRERKRKKENYNNLNGLEKQSLYSLYGLGK